MSSKESSRERGPSRSSKAKSKVQGDVYATSAEENYLITNMSEILDTLIRNDVHAKRAKVSNAVAKLDKKLQGTKVDREFLVGESGKEAKLDRSYIRVVAKRAHEAFENDVKDVKAYLEGIGFRNMEGHLYEKSEIEEIVKPINEGK